MNRRRLSVVLAGAAGALLAACSPLTAFNTLAPRDPAGHPGRDIAYGADPRQTLDVYTPKAAAGPAPVLVFFYGGGWSGGRRQDYAWVGQALAAQGFVVVVPDYRLVPQVRYPVFVQDSAAAVRWAQDHAAQFGGDPRRILLAGHSAGAYNAMMLALDPEFLHAAGVDPSAIRGVAGLSGPYDFYPFDVAASRNAFGQWPDPRATQPVAYASTPGKPPVFMALGDRDTTVEPRNSISLDRALRAAGNRSELKIYPGLNHVDTVLSLSRPFRGKAPVLEDMTAFLKASAG
jgi:acetyl esterase/lipase